MATKLVFIGKDLARRDPMRFLNRIRTRYPNLSEAGVQEIAKAELMKKAPRYSAYIECLYGADVLTEDPATIAAWPWMTKQLRSNVLRRSPSQRHTLIDPEGLSTTYVWRQSNGWTQDVEDSDVEVIRASAARTWFRDADRVGDWRPPRAYNFPVIEREAFTDASEAKAYEREQQRVRQWTGR